MCNTILIPRVGLEMMEALTTRITNTTPQHPNFPTLTSRDGQDYFSNNYSKAKHKLELFFCLNKIKCKFFSSIVGGIFVFCFCCLKTN